MDEGLQRVCRCEATIEAAILEGYACGRPDCWRTAEAKASFDHFVGELVARRAESGSRPAADAE